MTTTTTYDSIRAIAEVTPGTAEVKKYYFASEEVTTPSASVDNGVRRLANTNSKLTYVESTTPNYKFTNLKENSTYKIYSYAEDINGIKSNVYTTDVTTDAYKIPAINNVTLDSTENSITINVSGTNGDGTITEYYYSKDGGSAYTKTNSASHTFSGLTDSTTFYIKVYVKDNNGKESSIWSNSIATKEPLLTEYIKNLYTNQGVNNLYLHDETLVNGANDDSYRYAGSDYKLTDKAKREGYTIIFNGLFKKANNSSMKVTVAYDTENVEYTIDDAINKAVLDGYIIKNNINNYVCFGSDTTPCPEDNLYRIIGVFGNQVKLIKSNYESTVSGQWGIKTCGNGGLQCLN